MDIREAHRRVKEIFPKARMIQCRSTFEYPRHSYDAKAPDVVQSDDIDARHIIMVYADSGGMATWQVDSKSNAGISACVGMIEKKFPPSAIMTYVGTFEADERKRELVAKFIKDSYDAVPCDHTGECSCPGRS